MKYLISCMLLSILTCSNSYAQEKMKVEQDKIVNKNKDTDMKVKEKNTEFVAQSDSVKIKDRHGRVKTKDLSARTVIKEKANVVKFKNRNDHSWMKVKNGRVRKSANYAEKKDSVMNQ